MRYFAELDENQIVVRVIVADNPQWLADRLGGVWVETSDPYIEPTEITYAGPGMGYADNLPQLFADVWDETAVTMPLYNGGEIVWHQGRLWINITEGVPNNSEPGVSGWLDA